MSRRSRRRETSTARGSVGERVTGLEAGADDNLVKWPRRSSASSSASSKI